MKTQVSTVKKVSAPVTSVTLTMPSMEAGFLRSTLYNYFKKAKIPQGNLRGPIGDLLKELEGMYLDEYEEKYPKWRDKD